MPLLSFLRRKFGLPNVFNAFNAFWTGRAGAYQFIHVDYPISPKVRPESQPVRSLIDRNRARYRELLLQMATLIPYLARIDARAASPAEPSWINDFLPPLDAVAIYSFLATRNPRLYVEIGSGISTKFARRSIRDHNLRTRIISIDPHPQAEIDEICDEMVRQELQELDLALFSGLTAEDLIFFDGSHRSFQNSDATVFFCDIVPRLAVGTTVGVHDIHLPADYPVTWLSRFYNEQYLLACYLLGGDALTIELPCSYCTSDAEMHALLNRLWEQPNLSEVMHNGGAFWFRINRRWNTPTPQ
ncbi:MAG TPA: class I SAM-dependent methyltransferase [Stellaceae bacterium]|nr:class I SAM-dependent methyltransferase [Stellaceae bacterium]